MGILCPAANKWQAKWCLQMKKVVILPANNKEIMTNQMSKKIESPYMDGKTDGSVQHNFIFNF